MTLLLESGIVRTPCKEVAKGSIQISEGLLERNRRNLIEPGCLFLLFEQHQPLRSILVGQMLTTLGGGVSPIAQRPVIDIAATPKGTGKNLLLFVVWVKPILVGFLPFHALQYSTRAVSNQALPPLPSPKQGTRLLSPRLKPRGFTARFDNWNRQKSNRNQNLSPARSIHHDTRCPASISAFCTTTGIPFKTALPESGSTSSSSVNTFVFTPACSVAILNFVPDKVCPHP